MSISLRCIIFLSQENNYHARDIEGTPRVKSINFSTNSPLINPHWSKNSSPTKLSLTHLGAQNTPNERPDDKHSSFDRASLLHQ